MTAAEAKNACRTAKASHQDQIPPKDFHKTSRRQHPAFGAALFPGRLWLYWPEKAVMFFFSTNP